MRILLSFLLLLQLCLAPVVHGMAGEQVGVIRDENGKILDKEKDWEGSFEHAFLHGLACCAAAEATGADCAAGAAGGVAGSLVSGYFEKNPPATDPSLSARQQQAQRLAHERQVTKLISAFAGYVFSGGDASDVSTAAHIGHSVISNNRQLHIKEVELIVEYADEYAREIGLCPPLEVAPCAQPLIDRAKGELTAETLRGVADEFAFAPENSNARRFLNGLKTQGLVPEVAGQTLFGELDRQSPEYLNSTINMEHSGVSFWLYDKVEFDGLYANASATHAASSAIRFDLSTFRGSYGRYELVQYLEANKAMADYYQGLSQHLLDNIDELLASGAFQDPADIHDEASRFSILAAGFSVNNANAITYANEVWGGPLSFGDYWRTVNADGTANLIAQIHGGNLATISSAGLTTSLLVRSRFNQIKAPATNSAFTKESAFDVIDQFRSRKGGLDELGDSIPIKGDGQGTVAFVDVGGKPIFGVNSSTLVRDVDKDLGRSWRDRLGLGRGEDQIVWHAEGHSLMRAYEKTGGNMPSNVNMFVDRISCANCRTHLPKLVDEMGIDSLNLTFKNGRTGRISGGNFEWTD